jgi:hypothetical protein
MAGAGRITALTATAGASPTQPTVVMRFQPFSPS